MDWVGCKSTVVESIKKFRYVIVVVLAGIFLMALPEKQKLPTSQPPPETTQAQPDLQESLAGILSKISGAGKVEVLLTQSAGAQTIYQTDEDKTVADATSDIRRKTVLVTGSGREETGLVRQVNPPAYQGAVVVCQGADSAGVRLSIVEAVMSVTGLSSDRITVLKMK